MVRFIFLYGHASLFGDVAGRVHVRELWSSESVCSYFVHVSPVTYAQTTCLSIFTGSLALDRGFSFGDIEFLFII